MECHKCPFREKLEAGEYAQMAYDETPCAKCELQEYSDRTMEYVQDMESRIQNPPSYAEASASGTPADKTADMEEVLPVSVMSEVVFRLLSMTPETRDAVCWRFAGMSYQDIAILQGVTVAAVEKRHWKAMKKWPALRAMFATKVAKQVRRKREFRIQNPESRMFEGKLTERRIPYEKRNG